MFRRILSLPLMLGALAFTAAADSELELAGVYACNGKNPDGSSYDTVVEIVKQDGSFVLRWFDQSELVAVGLGIRKGDVLAVLVLLRTARSSRVSHRRWQSTRGRVDGGGCWW